MLTDQDDAALLRAIEICRKIYLADKTASYVRSQAMAAVSALNQIRYYDQQQKGKKP